MIGFLVVKEMIKRKNVKELALTDPLKAKDPESLEDFSDLETLEKDTAYSEHSDSDEIKSNDSDSPNTKKDFEDK